MPESEQVIEQLVEAFGPMLQDDRERRFVRESLRALVRLAKAEQILQLRQDVNLSIGEPNTKR